MRHLLAPALFASVVALASVCSIAADNFTQKAVEPPAGSARFNRLCEELMNQVLQQSNVKFAESSAEVGTNALGTLDEIVEIAFDCPSASITVTGHSDNTASETANLALSKARAESVVAYMIERGIDPARLSASGTDSGAPIAGDENAVGRRINPHIGIEMSFGRKKKGRTGYSLFL